MQRFKLSASVLCVLFLLVPQVSSAFVDVSISVGLPVVPVVALAPPPLPVYIVPPPPVVGLIWAPGHWRWSEFGYYWVPGTWVSAPVVGFLWTPGYWGYGGDGFHWHEGYWGQHVGFYGGVNYGGGYGGSGFAGGGWHNGAYVFNRATLNGPASNNVSFNGGPGGLSSMPSRQDQIAAREHHTAPTSEQINHFNAAGRDPQLRASVNNGRPAVAATARPGEFSGRGVVAATQAGRRNALAEQHNDSVRSNPSLAGHAALPKANSSATPNSIAEKHTAPGHTALSQRSNSADANAHNARFNPQAKPAVENKPAVAQPQNRPQVAKPHQPKAQQAHPQQHKQQAKPQAHPQAAHPAAQHAQQQHPAPKAEEHKEEEHK